MDDMDFEMEDMEGEGDEQQNRTFIILVAVMGGLLLIGIIAFCAWALIVGRGMLTGQADVMPTETPVDVVMDPSELVTPTEIATEETPEPPPPTETQAPRPTATRPAPSPTPAEASPEATREGTPPSVAQVTPTIAEQPTEEATAEATPPAATETPDTGIGAFTAVILAAGLLFILVIARRLRTAH